MHVLTILFVIFVSKAQMPSQFMRDNNNNVFFFLAERKCEGNIHFLINIYMIICTELMNLTFIEHESLE